jgi:hypothetical protein
MEAVSSGMDSNDETDDHSPGSIMHFDDVAMLAIYGIGAASRCRNSWLRLDMLTFVISPFRRAFATSQTCRYRLYSSFTATNPDLGRTLPGGPSETPVQCQPRTVTHGVRRQPCGWRSNIGHSPASGLILGHAAVFCWERRRRWPGWWHRRGRRTGPALSTGTRPRFQARFPWPGQPAFRIADQWSNDIRGFYLALGHAHPRRL